ncbi:hypothetical protein PBN151_2540 [Paenibacillus sp. NAIST15-1]|nr:hypothetical protein PBN151_2540 [Paenibacillus sp. NAIST15-1]
MGAMDTVSLITNLWFPVELVLKHILQTIGGKFNNLEETIKKANSCDRKIRHKLTRKSLFVKIEQTFFITKVVLF